jgi:hypothetical protein
MFRLVREFLRHVLPQILKPMRALWNEVIGFVFLALAVIPAPRTFRAWRHYNETGNDLARVALSVGFIVVMASFGIHSFWRARKITRS